MTNNPHSIESIESKANSSKSSKFIENTKRAVRKALATTGIVAGSMGPVTAPTVVPASVNTITAIAPLASTAIKTISLGTAAGLLVACGSGEDGPDGPINPQEKDNIAPTINLSQSEVDITGGKQVRIDGNQLYIGDILVASRSDNKSKSCKVELSLNGKSITSGTTISEGGTLIIKVSDEAGNNKNADIKLNLDSDISGLENLKNLNMQVDHEVNLLNGITFGNGAELVKVEIEIDGEKVVISDPNHYIPDYPGTCSIILTVKDKDGKVTEYKVDNLTINALEYKAMEINNIRPVDILPIIGQVEAGDTKAYEHIEHLRIAEATKIRDMMREYGAGDHSAEEYKQLMNRLNTGMTLENPKGYDNYETIGGNPADAPSNHAHDERNILNTLINHANLKILNPINQRYEHIQDEVDKHPNNIYILGNSNYAELDEETFSKGKDRHNIVKNLCKSKNFLIFAAGGNIDEVKGILKNQILHENVKGNEHGVYSLPSMGNGKNDSKTDIHLIVTVGTDADGDIDQTNEIYSSSKVPVGFHNDILFAGRTFPRLSINTGHITAESGKYVTSYVNYTNVAVADLCFQMYAEVKDVDELLNMIKSSTTLRDHIRFNGEDQPLILMNPEGFFQKYLMPKNTPTNIQPSKTAPLEKGYYKGVIFDIPGAEVNINGEWIAYNDANKSKIKSQNPMTLQWRINGDLCKKLGYKGKPINGKIIVVDDKWNGLNIDKDFTIKAE